MERPHRAYEIDIHIGADDWKSALWQIRDVLRHIEDHGEECSLVSGGSDSGATVTITKRPEMTHDRYFADLNAYLDAREAAKPATGGGGG